MPAFSSVLILKSGMVLATGEIKVALNSKNLSAAFGAGTRLRKLGSRYTLTVTSKPRAMM